MKTAFFTFEQFHRKKDIGSSRIRADWLIKNWGKGKAERYRDGENYDAIIFQKVYWVEYAKIFKGIKILDLCDADFLDWACRIKEMIEECDGITTSTEALAEVIRKYTDKPVRCIPDRVDMDYHSQKKIHSGEAKKAVWFGYAQNQKTIESVLPLLVQHKLGLIVVSNMPFIMPITYMGRVELINYPWSVKTANDDIIKADFVINPTFKYGNWQFKSNNKTLTAWALGMPVANTPDEVKRFMDEGERKKEAEIRLKETGLS